MYTLILTIILSNTNGVSVSQLEVPNFSSELKCENAAAEWLNENTKGYERAVCVLK